MIFLYVILAYLFIVFVVIRLVVPNLGFKRKPIPKNIPEELSKTIDRLNTEATSDENYLELAYKYVTTKHTGGHIRTLTNFWKAFLDPLCSKSKFMHCAGQNYLLRTLLIKSGRFEEKNIKIVIRFLDFFMHQYSKIKVNGKIIDVDPWADFIGASIGEKAKWFKLRKK